MMGTDSKVGDSLSRKLHNILYFPYLQRETLVHGSSHFTRNGGTDDQEYRQFACAGLTMSLSHLMSIW